MGGKDIKFPTEEQALRFERYLKSGSGRWETCGTASNSSSAPADGRLIEVTQRMEAHGEILASAEGTERTMNAIIRFPWNEQ